MDSLFTVLCNQLRQIHILILSLQWTFELLIKQPHNLSVTNTLHIKMSLIQPLLYATIMVCSLLFILRWTKHLKSMVTLPTLKARKLFPPSKCWMLSHQMANIYFKQLSTDGLDTSCQISLCLPVATSILLIWASVYQYHHLIFSLLSGIVVIRWTNLTL